MSRDAVLLNVKDMALDERISRFARPLMKPSPGLDPEVLHREVLETPPNSSSPALTDSTRSTWRSSSTSSTPSSTTAATCVST